MPVATVQPMTDAQYRRLKVVLVILVLAVVWNVGWHLGWWG